VDTECEREEEEEEDDDEEEEDEEEEDEEYKSRSETIGRFLEDEFIALGDSGACFVSSCRDGLCFF